MNLKREIFREYDIRGIYNTEINEEVAYHIGLAYGTVLKNKYNKNKCIVGYDNRLSSINLSKSLIDGIINTGINVINLGLVTTPMYYYAWDLLDTKCGVMITASHNPKEYNGFKFSYNGLHNAYGNDVYELYNIIINNNFNKDIGNVTSKDITNEYVDMLLSSIKLGNKELNVIYDCGNGTTSIIADKVFNKLNINAIPLYNTSDGNFPNHHPDPCVEDNLTDLKRKVLDTNADVGIAFDGDGDRVGVIDELGNYIPTDLLMIIIWRDIYNKVTDKRGLLDIKCSKSLEDEMIKLGIKPIIYRTGNSYTKAKMVEEKLPFGGELSGHLYFFDKFNGYDDGIYAGLRIIEILSNNNKKISELLTGINKYYNTPEIKIEVGDDIKFNVVGMLLQYVKNNNLKYLDIDGVKILFDDGFALIRASNTGPNITLRFEAKDTPTLNHLTTLFTDLVNKYIFELTNKKN